MTENQLFALKSVVGRVLLTVALFSGPIGCERQVIVVGERFDQTQDACTSDCLAKPETSVQACDAWCKDAGACKEKCIEGGVEASQCDKSCVATSSGDLKCYEACMDDGGDSASCKQSCQFIDACFKHCKAQSPQGDTCDLACSAESSDCGARCMELELPLATCTWFCANPREKRPPQ